ncbi:MAG: glycosyltransferase [Phycisphaerales bacterium]|nr:glycosyltransferase [Phycisphaerales bacterium]
MAAGINTVRTYTIPPRWLLDLAQKHGLRVMVGLPWEEHVAFLDDRKLARDILDRCRKMVRTCSGHPALLAFTIGNEIPSSIVRWHGARKVERYLHRLYRMVKREDAHCLVTYVNFPTTEYLRLPFLDFVSFNVYLEDWDKLTRYLAKLQSHAGDRPLIMAELGLDSLRNGEEKQAASLAWQLRTGFDAGCAGVFVFAWTDQWYRGGAEITDWAFGLTTRDRKPKPALEAVKKVYSEVPFPADRQWPRISVVVCTYNGKRLIRDCCEGLRELTYPDFEVLVIDDGSTDGVGEIPKEYGFMVIRTPNQGLSRARNVGMENATGEIIAYLDDDARPDPHWLHYLAHTYMTSNHVAVGGPNIPPPGDGPIADCVANSPGGPIHVLITDEIAEHIPGCNFSVRRDALLAVQGFDGTFRIAGDDVDCCWRLQDTGGTIGFSPAAMVWHHRRNSMKAYLKQQTNYGRAEAMLEKKWPGKYNAAGHIPWIGRIYGRGALQMFRLAPGRIIRACGGWHRFSHFTNLPRIFSACCQPCQTGIW